MINKRKIKQTLLIITLNFILIGCSNAKINECNRLIKVTDTLVEVTQPNLSTQDINKLLIIADQFDESAKQIIYKNFQDTTLIEYSKSLAIIYEKYGQITRDFITAFQTKDTEKAIFYKQEILTLSQEEKEIVNRINRYCQQN